MAAPDRQAWVQSLLPLAQQWEAKTGIPASMWLAMAASESNWGAAGTSLFGIKGSGNAGSLNSPTWESVNGQRVNQNANFASYNTANDAFQGFWDLVSTSPRYAGAMQQLQQGNPQGFLQGINQAGYATDPKWANTIQSLASTTIAPMIGAGGGKTMATMQDGTDPSLAIDPALVDAAINGDTLPVAGAGYVPDGNVGTVGANSPVSMASPQASMNGNDILQLVVDKIGPYISRVVLNPTTTTNDPTFGKTTGPTHAPTYRYTWANGKILDVAALDSGAVVKGGTALSVLSSGSSPAVREFPDHSLRQEDTSQPLGSTGRWVKIADAPAGTQAKTINTKGGTFENDGSGWTLIPGTAPAGASLQIHTFGDGSLHSYDPQTGQWALVQNRYVDPTEEAYKQSLTAENQAQTAKIQQGLRPVAQAAIQDAYATIAAIQQQLASGQITPKDADNLMAQVHDGLSATLAGTTLFEQQKQAQDTQTQRANTASNYLQQKIQSAASLGSTLLNAATGHVMLPKGQKTLGIDPFAIANQEVNQMSGGQSTGDAAAAFLKAALSGQSGAPAGPGGSPAPSQFPTTREAVLAAYPHLAQAPAPAVPANVGGGVQPQVTPAAVPMPLSPQNQLIQAGGR
jgi:hypothetical protein